MRRFSITLSGLLLLTALAAGSFGTASAQEPAADLAHMARASSSAASR